MSVTKSFMDAKKYNFASTAATSEVFVIGAEAKSVALGKKVNGDTIAIEAFSGPEQYKIKVTSSGLVTLTAYEENDNGKLVAGQKLTFILGKNQQTTLKFLDGSLSLTRAADGKFTLGTQALAINKAPAWVSGDGLDEADTSMDLVNAVTGGGSTFTLAANTASANEGETVFFTLEGSSYAGSQQVYTISGGNITADDIESGSLAGIATFDAHGRAIIAVKLKADTTTEGLESLTLTVAGKSATVAIADTSITAPVQTSWTVTASDIAVANLGTGIVSVQTGDTGAQSVLLKSDGITAQNGFIISGEGDITVTAGVQGDTITLVGNGNNVINAGTGAGNDTINIIGTGSNTINVGAGNDNVSGSAGKDTIVFAAGALTAADAVDGGLGEDTVVISGEGNVIDAGNLVNIEHLVLDGTTVQINGANLQTYIANGLLDISGHADSSVITIAAANGDTVDLTGLSLKTLKELVVSDTGGNGTVKLVLTADQIAAVNGISAATGDTLAIQTTVAGIQALGTKAPAATLTVVDTQENLIAAGNLINDFGATVEISAPVTVAQAVEILSSGLNLSYQLADTAANLALAPVAAFNNATAVTATTNATASQASEIQASIAASNLAAHTVDLGTADITLDVADTASNLANYLDDAIDADSVTASNTLSAAEATALYGLNTEAGYAVVDSAANIVAADETDPAFDNATGITLTGTNSVADVAAVRAAAGSAIASGYTLSGAHADLVAAGAAVITNAGNIAVTDTLTVAQALAIEALGNTGTNSYGLEGTAATLVAANSAVVNSATSVAISDLTVTAANMNAIVAKFGTVKFADADTKVSDTVANLLKLSANAVAEASAVEISSGTGSVAQIVALKALTGGKMPAIYTVTDSAANLAAAVADTATLALLDGAGTVSLSGSASVEQVAAINNALAGELANTFTLSDTAANLVAAAADTPAGAGNALGDAAQVVVTDAATVASIDTINGAAGLALGTTLTYALSDTAAALAAAGATVDGATTVTVTGAATVAQIGTIADDFTTTGDDAVLGTDIVYAITDEVANIVTNPAVLATATQVTLKDTVANLQAADGLTAIALATVDTVVAEDTLANLTAATTAKTNADAFVLTNTVGSAPITAANAAAVNALAAIKPTTYTVFDAYGDLVTDSAAASEAIATLLAGAAAINVDTDDADADLDGSLSIAQFNVLDGLTAATINCNLSDTIANFAAADAATAVANAAAVTISDTDGTVAQISTLAARGLDVSGLTLVDTAASINAAVGTLVADVGSVVVSDNGTLTLNVASLVNVYSADGSSYGNYNIVDTAAAILTANGINGGLVDFAQNVTVTEAASAAQAVNLAALTAMGTVSYSVSDTAAAVAGAAGPALNAATNITVTGTATVAQATTINAATNSGSTSYSISDTATNLATAVAAEVTGIETATGTVTASTAATGAEATAIAALAKAVEYSISDTAGNLGATTVTAAALNEAVNIAMTGTANAAQAAKLLAATNSGTTTLDAVSVSAAEAKALALTANDIITTLTVTGTTSAADAAAIAAMDTGANIGTLAIDGISGTYAELMAAGADVLGLATAVTATDAITLAQLTAANGTIDAYSLADSWANLMANRDVTGDVDADAAITGAATVTVTDAALTVAQAAALCAVDAGPTYVYNIVDNDANLVAAMAADQAALLGATSVKGYNNVALSFETVNGTFSIVGSKASLSALSGVLQAASLCYEVTVADLETDSAFYSTLGGNQAYRITDTVENLSSGQALIPAASEVVASTAATVLEAQEIETLLTGDFVFELADTAANLAAAAGGTLDDAVKATATTAATFAEAKAIVTANPESAYSISDAGANFDADGINGATNITVTGSTTAATAATLLAATNSGATTIALVTGTSADLAALTLGANDAITAMTPSNAATVEQLVAMLSKAGSLTAWSLSDTAANLAAAPAGVLNGATNIALSGGTATVAETAIIDAATNSGTNTYGIADTAAKVLAADAALLGTDANDAIVITDTFVTAAVATQLRAFDTANTGFTINQGGAAGVFTIEDTYANLTAAGNAAAVTAGTVTVTDTVSVAQATAVVALNAAAAYDLADTYSKLALGGAVTSGAQDVTITNSVTVSQATLANAWTNGGDLSFNVRDTAANVANNAAGADVVASAAAIEITTAATVAQAGYLSDMVNVASYTISDTAANVQAALDTANGASAQDRETILGAAAITLTTDATVAEACGDLGSESRGLQTIAGLQYSIADTGAAITQALADGNAAGIQAATKVYLASATGITVSTAETLTALANFGGYDTDRTDNVAGIYNITDSFGNIQAADTLMLERASVVTANGTADGATTADTINLSMMTRGMSINGNDGDDTITGTDLADVITGGDGADTFVFAAGASTGAGGAASDGITDLAVGDIIDLTAIEAIGAINFITAQQATALDGTGITFTAGLDVFVGTVGGQDYLFYETTAQGTGATDAGILEVVGIDIVGTLGNWTEAAGVITVVI